MLAGAVMVVAPTGAGATQPNPVHKVTICHRTNAVTNPYVTPTVDFSSVDGEQQKGPDHMGHGGDVFEFDASDAPTYDTTYPKPRNGDQWGDIIPPVPYGEGEWGESGWTGSWTPGLNWSDDGKAAYFGTDVVAEWPELDQEFYAEPYDAVCGAGEEPPETTLTVHKVVDGPEGATPVDWTFDFDGDLGEFSISEDDDLGTDDDETEFSAVIDGGTGYEVSEVDAKNAVSTSVSCENAEIEMVNGEPLARIFTVAEGGHGVCTFTNTYRQQSSNSVTIVKTNNADGNSTYSDNEQTTSGATVPFRIVITNTGDDPLDVTELKDTWPTDNELDLLEASAGLTCTTPGDGEGSDPVEFDMGEDLLEPDVPVTCDFTIAEYITGSGASITNTVTLDTDKTEPVSDTSKVTTPRAGGCVVDCGGPDPTYSVDVDKVNDADRNGNFTNSETARRPGQSVEFQVTIRNTGTGTLTLEALTDEFGGADVNLLEEETLDCGDVALTDGSTLASGSTVVCTFTLDGYAPAAGTSVVNTVTIDTDRADDSDDSRVRTRRVQVLPNEEERPPVTPPGPPPVAPPAPPAPPAPAVKGDVVTRQLPRTGSESSDLAGFGAGFLLLGAGLVLISRGRRFGIAE
ncbi:MAG: LPXTG cell wall anchor domain-containing protein [Acidimicrobiia bacterium]